MITAKYFLESVTGIKINSDKVHLYNIEAKDLINWMDEYAELKNNSKKEPCICEKKGISALDIRTDDYGHCTNCLKYLGFVRK